MRPIDIEVVDNFISPSYLNALQDAVHPNSLMSWSFQGSQSGHEFNEGDIEDFGFSIPLCTPDQPDTFFNTPIATFVSPLVYLMKDYAEADSIIRCRLDLTLFHSKKYLHPPHIDVPIKHVATILYLNDTDGDTVIYDQKGEYGKTYSNMKIKETISPKAGRMLLFDGSYVHTGHSPSKHQTRILLNTVLS